MKILIYSHFFLPSLGGVEKLTYLLARFLQESGHETAVVTQTPARDEDRLPFRVLRHPSVQRLLGEIRTADVIHMQGFVLVPFLLSKLNSRPVVWVHHGYDVTCPKIIGWKDGHDTTYRFAQCAECLLRDHTPHEALGLIVLLHVKRIFRNLAEAHVSPSRHVQVHEGLTGEVIPNGVDVDAYTPEPSRKEVRRILFLGRLIREKGAEVLLRAFRRLATSEEAYHLRFVGDGRELASLRTLTRKMGLDESVSFSPGLSGSELIQEIQRASVLCAPTLMAEAFGIVGLEALACGTPLVASDRGGFPEFSTGVAYLVPAGDEYALTDALRLACSDPETARRVEEGRQRVSDHYDYRIIGSAYLRLYESLIRGRT